MVKISVHYDGSLRCTATHGPSDSTLSTDAPKDNEGRGETFSPTDLVATALASCMLTTMAIVAKRNEIPFEGATAEVEKIMVADPDRRIGGLPATIHMPAGLDETAVTKLERAALFCPVKRSLGANVDAPITFSYPDRK